jgi:hypothetical protein
LRLTEQQAQASRKRKRKKAVQDQRQVPAETLSSFGLAAGHHHLADLEVERRGSAHPLALQMAHRTVFHTLETVARCPPAAL